ncbi:MAG: ABC transporter substrate-binding protein [Ancrocorticia sp.]|jgi:putative spermidine/putrescine transport system substrate-binding protein|nr:ABC transporter substrate-binding protein [Ancrocorticia sp.]
MKISRFRAEAITVALALTLSACGQSNADAGDSASGTGSDTDWSTVTSVEEGGGMDALVAAAEAEGSLNVIALPHSWANYGEVIQGFKDKYPEITVNEINPNASSKEEIDAAKTNEGTDKAPDVFDLGLGVATTNTDKFAAYKVQNWDQIPDGAKESTGLFYGDYTGIMTIGWNKTKYGDIDVDDLKDTLSDSKFKGTVALNGKPYEAGAAQNGFLAVNLNQGGSITDFQPGLDFFEALKEAGTLTQIDVTDATIDSGQTGVVFDWNYNQASTASRLKEQQGVDWEVKTLPNGEVAQYYNQAINKDAPHPAAARLWEECLYTAEAQNLWLKGGAFHGSGPCHPGSLEHRRCASILCLCWRVSCPSNTACDCWSI